MALFVSLLHSFLFVLRAFSLEPRCERERAIGYKRPKMWLNTLHQGQRWDFTTQYLESFWLLPKTGLWKVSLKIRKHVLLYLLRGYIFQTHSFMHENIMRSRLERCTQAFIIQTTLLQLQLGSTLYFAKKPKQSFYHYLLHNVTIYHINLSTLAFLGFQHGAPLRNA